MLTISECSESIGSDSYVKLMLKYSNDWQSFLSDIASDPDRVVTDQWQFQMQCRVLEKIGREKLFFISDGISYEIQDKISVNPVLGSGNVRERAQGFIDTFVKKNPDESICVIPEGPYTLLNKES